MAHQADIHKAQTLILRELLFLHDASFAELQKPTQLSSDNFTFHIKKLTELGYVEKGPNGRYSLTTVGKEHANKLDTDKNTIERQPKSAVILVIEREKDGNMEYLFQQRLKHPYFGYWGCPTGKVTWGESILETASRELMEETNMTANYRHAGVYHERVYDSETKEMLEDKIFHVIHCTDVKGELMEEFEGGKNVWMSYKTAWAKQKKFESFKLEIEMVTKEGHEHFIERKVYLEPSLF